MEKEFSRRDFFKKSAQTTTGIIYLASPLSNLEVLAQTPQPSILKSREDLYHISEQELLARILYGEARSCSKEEMFAIAYTAENRKKDGKYYNGEGSLRNVLLKNERGHFQYNCTNDIDKENAKNFAETLNPTEKESWESAMAIAKSVQIISTGKLPHKLNKGQIAYITKSELERMRRENKTPKWIKKSKKIPFHGYNFEHIFLA